MCRELSPPGILKITLVCLCFSGLSFSSHCLSTEWQTCRVRVQAEKEQAAAEAKEQQRWWQARYAQAERQAQEAVAAQLDGDVAGTADAMPVRRSSGLQLCWGGMFTCWHQMTHGSYDVGHRANEAVAHRRCGAAHHLPLLAYLPSPAYVCALRTQQQHAASTQHAIYAWAAQGVFCWRNGRPQPGAVARLFYNRDSSDLRHKRDLLVHLGCNGWDAAPAAIPLAEATDADTRAANLPSGMWYAADVTVPQRARVLDFVLSDANREVWDNNRQRDFHTAVQSGQDRGEMEAEEYRRVLSASREADAKEARRSGARRWRSALPWSACCVAVACLALKHLWCAHRAERMFSICLSWRTLSRSHGQSYHLDSAGCLRACDPRARV